jgi:hypothetical protein
MQHDLSVPNQSRFNALGLAFGAAVTGLLFVSLLTPLEAQDFQTRLPAFQAPASDNLEAEMMRRISLSGELQPGDLARLSRLAVLNTISMLVNVRADIRNSPRAFQLEEELNSLWNSSEAFYEVVSESPLDAGSVNEAQYWLDAMSAARRTVEGSLGDLPGVSPRAANNLRAFSRLLVPIGSAVDAIEADMAALGRTADRPLDLDSLRSDFQVVANALVSLIQLVGDAGRGRIDRDAMMTELTDLLARVQSISRLLATQPSQKAVQDSFRMARQQMWRVESRLRRLEWRTAVEPSWREVRDRLNAVSNKLGLPRVIEVARELRPLTGRERSIAAHVDHAIAWLDEFVATSERGLRKTEDGSRFLADAVSLRNKILNVRRRAIAGEAPERLGELLHIIEGLNQELANRAAAMRADTLGANIESRYRNSAEAIRKIKAVAEKG